MRLSTQTCPLNWKSEGAFFKCSIGMLVPVDVINRKLYVLMRQPLPLFYMLEDIEQRHATLALLEVYPL